MLCAPGGDRDARWSPRYPIIYAFWLSLHETTCASRTTSEFIGFENYGDGAHLEPSGGRTSPTPCHHGRLGRDRAGARAWLIAIVMHRTIFGRGLVRTSVLVPYGIVTVVAAFAWRFAFDPTTGFVNGLLHTDAAGSPSAGRRSA